MEKYTVQYGKSSSRIKKILTDDGCLSIQQKSCNSWQIILCDCDGKEIYRRSVSETTKYQLGNTVTIGNYDVYFDTKSSDATNTIKSNVCNNDNTTNQLKLKLNDSLTKPILPQKKFVLQSKTLNTSNNISMFSSVSLKSICASSDLPTATSEMSTGENSSTTIKTNPNNQIIKNTSISQNTSTMTNIKADKVITIDSLIIPTFQLKLLKPHQLEAVNFLLKCLIGQNPSITYEQLYYQRNKDIDDNNNTSYGVAGIDHSLDYILSSSSSAAPSLLSKGYTTEYDDDDEEEEEEEEEEDDDDENISKYDYNKSNNINMNRIKSVDTDQKYYGAILADEMGLGKTFVSLTVMWTLIKYLHIKALIICPSSLVANWLSEIKKWIGDFRLKPYCLLPGQNNTEVIQQFCYGHIPMLILSYEMYRKYAISLNRIVNLDLLICDEGHRLKNCDSTQTMEALRTSRAKMRLLLTGTPIQNDLDEVYALVNFINPGYLGTLSEYKAFISTPITISNHPQSTIIQKQTGQTARSHLQQLLSYIMIRRTQMDILRSLLPPRTDIAIYCKLSSSQQAQYDFECIQLMRSLGMTKQDIKQFIRQYHEKNGNTDIPNNTYNQYNDTITTGRKDSCNNNNNNNNNNKYHVNDDDKDVDSIYDDNNCDIYSDSDNTEGEAEEVNNCNSNGVSLSFSSVLPYLQKLRLLCYKQSSQLEDELISRTSQTPKLKKSKLLILNKKLTNVNNNNNNKINSFSQLSLSSSSKLQVLTALLQSLHYPPNQSSTTNTSLNKSVIVSNFTSVLDDICKIAESYQYLYYRLDGSTPMKKRHEYVTAFNHILDKHTLFLLSCKAGGMGLNLIGANRLIMIDCDWNPANDIQAMSRIWRPGQLKPVYIYRLIGYHSIEHSILQRQAKKLDLSSVMHKMKTNDVLFGGTDDSSNTTTTTTTTSVIANLIAMNNTNTKYEEEDKEDINDENIHVNINNNIDSSHTKKRRIDPEMVSEKCDGSQSFSYETELDVEDFVADILPHTQEEKPSILDNSKDTIVDTNADVPLQHVQFTKSTLLDLLYPTIPMMVDASQPHNNSTFSPSLLHTGGISESNYTNSNSEKNITYLKLDDVSWNKLSHDNILLNVLQSSVGQQVIREIQIT